MDRPLIPIPFQGLRRQAIGLYGMAMILLGPAMGLAQESALKISTVSEVNNEGKVTLTLTLLNAGDFPLYHLHPMFHFHHAMSAMPMIHRLDPGRSVTLKNEKHPPVNLVGSYPVVAMVHYKEAADDPQTRTLFHTDSFYYKEPMVSRVEGQMGVEVNENSSILKILLKNPSPSFKNVRMMLLLPPELRADSFQGMKGFTIQSGEEKYFEVPVSKVTGQGGGVYPVHLLVEYGERSQHFSRDIAGQINFGPLFGQGPFWPQMLVFAFLTVTLLLALQKRYRLPQSA